MKKNSTHDIPKKILAAFDPVVPCSWLPDHEVRLSEYNAMNTYFVQKRFEEMGNAKSLYSKDQSIR